LSLKTKIDSLLVVCPQNHWVGFSSVWASKPMATVCEWFDLKTTRTVFTGLTSKSVATISSGLASKPVVMVSSSLTSKPAAMVSGGLASKPAVTVFSSLASKLVMMVSPGLASKPRWWRVSQFGPQNRQLWFGDLCLKITAMVFWFGSQSKWVSVCRLHHKTDGGRSAWDTHRDLAACFTWKQV
jgi:hypothetical protein